eukprot:SM000103S09521  [mRNA]  locus=s103:439088:439531:+ [translate_table: standard]
MPLENLQTIAISTYPEYVPELRNAAAFLYIQVQALAWPHTGAHLHEKLTPWTRTPGAPQRLEPPSPQPH